MEWLEGQGQNSIVVGEPYEVSTTQHLGLGNMVVTSKLLESSIALAWLDADLLATPLTTGGSLSTSCNGRDYVNGENP